MSLNLNAGAPPIFLSVPYVTSSADLAGQIVATSMQGLIHRIYQMDPSAYWLGSLGASDSTDEVITIGLYVGALNVAATIDTLIILNHNLNNFDINYCTDYTPASTPGNAGTGTWHSLVSVTGQAGADYVRQLASPVANINGLQIILHSTSPANQNKQVGNFIAALATFQMSVAPMVLKPSYRQKRVDVQLADGSIDTTYFLWSDNSFTMTDYDIEIDFANVYAATDKSNFDALFKSPSPFLFMPEPGDSPRDVFLSLFDPKSYVAGFSSQWKNGGRKIPFKTVMVGYI